MKRTLFFISMVSFLVSLQPLWGVEAVDVPIELKKLKSKQYHQRMEAIERLGRSQDKAASSALISALKSEKNGRSRAKMVESLVAASKDAAVSKEIVNVLKTDTDREARFSAAYALGYTRDEAAIPVLMNTFLNDQEELGVRLQAAGALNNYTPSNDMFACFETALGNKNPDIRIQAITSLSVSFGDSVNRGRIIPLLRKMQSDPEERVRVAARERLEILGIH